MRLEGEAHVARSLARAHSLDEVAALIVGALEAAELRGFLAEWRGDELHVLGAAMAEPDAVRLEEICGLPFAGADTPLGGGWLSPRDRFHTIQDEYFPGRTVRLMPHLTEAEKAEVRHLLGPGPLFAAPVEAGDSLLGVLVAWGPLVVPQRNAIETLAAQAGPAWRGILEQPHHPRRHSAPTSTRQPAALRTLLDSGGIRVALQPIVRLTDDTVVGYEALCRFPATAGLATPDDLFAAAAGTGLESEVHLACLAAGFASSGQVGPATLFLNVPVDMLVAGSHPGDDVRRLADRAGVSPASVVLEVSERSPVDDLSRLRRVVADLRAHGFRIAIDDAGAGHASMLVIAEVQPEFVKVDHRLIHAVNTSAARRALVVSLLSFGAHINARVIAEGIETSDELRTLMSLGVQFGQGWHLGRPAILAPSADLIDVVEVGPGWFADRQAQSFVSLTQAGATAGVDPPAARAEAAASVDLPTALINAATALQSEHDPRGILGVIAGELQKVVPVDDLTIYTADQTSRRFIPVLATGDSAAITLAHSFSMDMGMTGWAFALGTPQYVPNSNDHEAAMTIPGTPVDEPESLLLIPLIAGDRALGMLNCRRLGLERFSEKDLEAAALFGHTAAAAWRNAELYAELSERATTDPLTGLLNSRWLRDIGDRELAQSRRSGRPVALLLIDLDHFKEINDTAGHATGDLVLQRVAAELRAMVRAGDAAVRLGGEEFVLMLRDAEVDAAYRIADELRTRLSALSLPRSCRPRHRLTASIGIARFPDQAQTLQALIRAADLAMYAAKRGGRDRVSVYGEVATGTPTGDAA